MRRPRRFQGKLGHVQFNVKSAVAIQVLLGNKLGATKEPYVTPNLDAAREVGENDLVQVAWDTN